MAGEDPLKWLVKLPMGDYFIPICLLPLLSFLAFIIFNHNSGSAAKDYFSPPVLKQQPLPIRSVPETPSNSISATLQKLEKIQPTLRGTKKMKAPTTALLRFLSEPWDTRALSIPESAQYHQAAHDEHQEEVWRTVAKEY
jgi:hypothetical protein